MGTLSLVFLSTIKLLSKLFFSDLSIGVHLKSGPWADEHFASKHILLFGNTLHC